MSRILEVSLMPNQTMSTGRNATFGTGYASDTRGSVNPATGRTAPASSPSPMPSPAPSANPASDR